MVPQQKSILPLLAVVLTGTVFLPSAAEAAPTPPVSPSQGPPRLVEASDVPVTAGISGGDARKLSESLGGSRTGGVFLNSSGRMVIAVTDQAAAHAVRDAGGIAQVVTYSTNTLKGIHSELDKLAGIPGTSWGVDPATNQVSVELDSTVDAADTARLKAVAGRFGSAVRVDRIAGKLEMTEMSSGGDRIEDATAKKHCSIGFNVADGAGHTYFVTAGHCTSDVTYWYSYKSGTYLGAALGSSFPGNDYGMVRYWNTNILAYGTVLNDTQQISSSRNPYDGEKVSRDGGYSTDRVGQVLLTSTTVTNRDGQTMYGMIKASNCALGGDSGGPLYHGTVGLGLLSQATAVSTCTDSVSDQRSYYQPLQEVLDVYGLHVY